MGEMGAGGTSLPSSDVPGTDIMPGAAEEPPSAMSGNAGAPGMRRECWGKLPEPAEAISGMPGDGGGVEFQDAWPMAVPPSVVLRGVCPGNRLGGRPVLTAAAGAPEGVGPVGVGADHAGEDWAITGACGH